MQGSSGGQARISGALVLRWHASSISKEYIIFFRLCCLAVSVLGVGGFVAIRTGSIVIDDGSSGTQWIALVVGVISGFLGLNLFIETQTIIDPKEQRIYRQSILCGRIVLFSRQFQFDDFKSLILKRATDSERSSDTIFMGLRRKNNRRFWLRYWNVAPESTCLEAEQMAEKLTEQIGIAIER